MGATGDPKGDEKGAKPAATNETYIEQWQDEAIRQMQKYGIPASITLAQGILESGNGVSELAQRSNNHFGIKCHSTWTGKRTYHDDDEKGECFRVYDDAKDSYEDHSHFLLRDRYARLFELEPTDYKGWAKGLKACGYATDPSYANRLITLIEKHDLNALDVPGGRWDGGEEAVASNNSSDKGDKARTKGNRGAREDVNVREHDVVRKANTGGGTVELGGTHRVRTTVHGVQFVYAEAGDTKASLTKDLDLMPWQIRTYNEVGKQHEFKAGDRIYMQPKKAHAATPWYTVRQGQTLWQISQMHGIRTPALARKNNLKPDSPLRPGMKLSLQWPLTKEGKLPWWARAMGAQ
ncbi:MAG: glucosaminidase domain-containing protein [Flavobacteriales bacterium]|nr:glucosaminidase domain-containing protein [Flavobacteriales bacterium]